jgi:ubiquinone/menaquinone biosynthesis C-methylase UbiE
VLDRILALACRPHRLPSKLADRVPVMKLLDMFYGLSPGAGRLLCWFWYQHMSRLDKDVDMTFMNYGYADLDPAAGLLPLDPEFEPDRYCIQLYHHVASQVELAGRDVLEVGCGRGGGAAYVARSLRPRSTVGMDLAGKAVDFCRRHHVVPRLSFAQGAAEALPFPDQSFDVILNVESSHCYSSMDRFLTEVRRVLRPAGFLLLADRRERSMVPLLREQMNRSGLQVLSEDRITANIVRALDLDDSRKQSLIHSKVPVVLRKAFKHFAATRNTSLYRAFCAGSWEYLSFVLRKPA